MLFSSYAGIRTHQFDEVNVLAKAKNGDVMMVGLKQEIIKTRCQYWHFRGMLWPHLFPLYASHIFKASLLRYGVLEIMRNFILTRGRYISEGYFYFLSYYSRAYEKLFSDDPAYYSRAYEKLFSDDPARLHFITSLKNVRGSITLKSYRQGYLYILPSRQNTICQ